MAWGEPGAGLSLSVWEGRQAKPRSNGRRTSARMNGNPLGGAPQVREPIFFIPAVVLAFVVALLGAHAVLMAFSEAVRDQIYFDWGFVPGRFTGAVAPQWIRRAHRARRQRSQRACRRATPAGDRRAHRRRRLSHAGDLCVAAWLLGPRRAQHHVDAHIRAPRRSPLRAAAFRRLLLLYGDCRRARALDVRALFGLSGDRRLRRRFRLDGGGGALRFPPRRRARRPAPRAIETRASSLRELVFDRRALVFIAIWMATNFLFGIGATTLGASDAPVAWIAHVGGFVAGLLAFGLFDRGSAARASA